MFAGPTPLGEDKPSYRDGFRPQSGDDNDFKF